MKCQGIGFVEPYLLSPFCNLQRFALLNSRHGHGSLKVFTFGSINLGNKPFDFTSN